MEISQNEWTRALEAIRAACISAAQQSYQQASASGLCAEGAFEAAIGAMQTLDLIAIIGTMERHAPK